MTYRDPPEFRDENERLIWCTAFATHELHHPGRMHSFQNATEGLHSVRVPRLVPWQELARRYADRVLAGYRGGA